MNLNDNRIKRKKKKWKTRERKDLERKLIRIHEKGKIQIPYWREARILLTKSRRKDKKKNIYIYIYI